MNTHSRAPPPTQPKPEQPPEGPYGYFVRFAHPWGGGGFINGYRPERESETVSVALDEQVDIAACLAFTSGQG